MIEFESEELIRQAIATIKVVGVGGAGGNTVNSIVKSGKSAIECTVINTDVQALEMSCAHNKVQIGVTSTKGLGTGSNPEIGKKAAEEDLDAIEHTIGSADIVFLSGGMGGGTGSGAIPVIARMLKEKGILCIALVTKPFEFEGKRRAFNAVRAIESLAKEVDTLIVIPNQKLLEYVDQSVSMIDAFAMINDVLCKAVYGISNIITRSGHINVDFADVRTIMKDRGLAIMGSGKSSGKHRAREAALQALASPLLENMSMHGAQGVLLNITGGRNLALYEIQEAARIVYEQADEDAHIILGSVIDDTMTDDVEVTLIATGLPLHSDTSPVQVKATLLDRTDIIHVDSPAQEEKRQQERTDTIKNDYALFMDKSDAREKILSQARGKLRDVDEQDTVDFDVPTFLRNRTNRTENIPPK
jgi:cell division protein FtsZ